MTADILIDMELVNGTFMADMKKTKARINAVMKSASTTVGKANMLINSSIKKTGESVNTMGMSMKQGTRAFQGWAMSIMFFGMALQRAFSSIWRNSQKTFNDVMHSVEGTVTQFDMLGGSIKYLQFVAGAALEPLLFYIIPIIDMITDWIMRNEKLFAGIVAVGTVIGTVFAIGGAAALAVNGFIDLFGKLGIVALGEQGKIEGMNWARTGEVIKKGIGFISIGYGLVQAVDAFKDFKEGKVFSGMINALSSAALLIGGIKVLKGAKGGGALIAIGVALELIDQGVFFTSIFTVFGIVGAFIAAIFRTTAKIIGDTIQYALKIAVVSGIVDGIIWALGHLPGFKPLMELMKIDTSGMHKRVDEYARGLTFDQNNYAKMFIDDFTQGLAASIQKGKEFDLALSNIIDTANNLGKPTATSTTATTYNNYGDNYYTAADPYQQNTDNMYSPIIQSYVGNN